MVSSHILGSYVTHVLHTAMISNVQSGLCINEKDGIYNLCGFWSCDKQTGVLEVVVLIPLGDLNFCSPTYYITSWWTFIFSGCTIFCHYSGLEYSVALVQ